MATSRPSDRPARAPGRGRAGAQAQPAPPTAAPPAPAGALVPFALGVTPLGDVVLDPSPPPEARLLAEVAGRLSAAFARGAGAGILHLGAAEVRTALPASVGFFRDLGHRFVARLCATPDLEALRERVQVPAAADELAALLAAAPPLQGGEYLDARVLEGLWERTAAALTNALAGHRGTVEEWLRANDPSLHLVGRVHLHLAENRKDPQRPFAFLATYTTGLSRHGKVQHRPLGDAVRDRSDAADREALLSLLVPLQRAAGASGLVRELVDSGQVFRPLAWTPAQAHRFLQEASACEEAGVVVRVPDWWRPKGSPRLAVQVVVGRAAPAGLGLDALLDFSAGLCLDGEPLTAAEWKELAASTEGLALVRGKWVELDRERLQQVLDRWDAVRRANPDGLELLEAMRLLSGAAAAGEDGPSGTDPVRWSSVTPGAWLSDTLARLRGETLEGPQPVPGLAATLRPYQVAGVRWLRLLHSLGLGACLADDMGLGKTIQVLALLLLLQRDGGRGKRRPSLVVAPASLLANWGAEAERFAPSLRRAFVHPAFPAASSEETRAADLVITSYGMLARTPALAGEKWELVVLDEAQAVKNAGTKQARAVKALSARARVALTGTPVENRLSDLWSIFDFLAPGLLGSADRFRQLVRALEEKGDFAPLRSLCRPYLLRRLKTDPAVAPDLPPRTEVVAHCALSKAQVVLYQQTVEELAQELPEASGMERRGRVLAALVRLKQICNHPAQWLGTGDWDPARSGKLQRLAELCASIAERQEKVLVFTQFREAALPLAARLSEVFGRPGLVLHGGTPVRERRALVERFQADEAVPFFVLSLKAGGTGLNLTAASHVVHFDRWWNPAVEDQATDRAHRIGQRKAVLVHKLVCRGTLEERIDSMLRDKQQLSREVLGGGGEALLTEMPDDELLRVVSLDVDKALDGG